MPLELDISSERRYKNVVLSSGFVNRSAICSLVGIQLMLMMRRAGKYLLLLYGVYSRDATVHDGLVRTEADPSTVGVRTRA